MPACGRNFCTTITASRSSRLLPADSSASCCVVNSNVSVFASNCRCSSTSAFVFELRFSMMNLLRLTMASLSSRPFSVSPESGARESAKLIQVFEILCLDTDLFFQSPASVWSFLISSSLAGPPAGCRP